MEPQHYDFPFEQQCPSYSNQIEDIDIFFSFENIAGSSSQKMEECSNSGISRTNSISWAHILDERQQKEQRQPQLEQQSKGLFESKSCRKKSFIEISDKKRNDYLQTVKGHKEQTAELNINFKTITKSILREQFLFNDFSSVQKDVISNFQTSNPNFKSFQQLFGVEEEEQQKDDFEQTNEGFRRNDRRTQTQIKESLKPTTEFKRKQRRTQTEKNSKYNVRKKSDRIRKICLKNFSSCKMIQQTLKSCRMNPYNKVVTLKFIEQIREGCIKPESFNNWKGKLSSTKSINSGSLTLI